MTSPNLDRCLATVPLDLLPDGQTIWPRFARQPMYWMSDDPPAPGDWSRLRALHPRSGLWPVFMDDEPEDEPPWRPGTLGLTAPSSPEDYDATTVLETLWAGHLDPTFTDGPEEVARMRTVTEPFGQYWPGLAPAAQLSGSADLIAEDFAERLINTDSTRLVLVPVSRGADVPAHISWQGAIHMMDPEALTSVLRSWEDRFGARLIRLGVTSIVLSVSAPPTTHDAALHVAAEHSALCRNNIASGERALSSYAEDLVDVKHWSFSWDEPSLLEG